MAIRKVKKPDSPALPSYRVTVRRVSEKTVDGVASVRFGDGPLKIRKITSDELNSWEMFSTLTSWLHAEATKVKQEERIRGMKLVNIPGLEEAK